MLKVGKSPLIALAGLATSFATALAVVLVNEVIGLNFFTFSLLVVIPVGAILCGFAAAPGYYLAAKWLHQRPTKLLLFQIVVIAALTQLLIYWLEYRFVVVEGVSAYSVVSFAQYLDISLTSSHLRMGRGGRAESGEVGSFGYWLAAFQFVGFLIGGGFVYLFLDNLPNCENCSKYLDETNRKEDSFLGFEEFAEYYDNVYAYPVDSLEFRDHVGRSFSAGEAQQGSINLTTTIYECPECENQEVREQVQVYNGSEWKDVSKLSRSVKMPRGVDVRAAFNA